MHLRTCSKQCSVTQQSVREELRFALSAPDMVVKPYKVECSFSS